MNSDENELKKTENGYRVNISALSGQLLEKVEELFLHTIDQQKTIKELKKDIIRLQDQNSSMDAENKSLKARLLKIETALGLNRK